MIWGWREKYIKIVQHFKSHCPNCRNESILFHFFAKYIHIFWIPLLPIGKRIVAHCDECNCSYEDKAIPESLQPDLLILKSQFRFPSYLFTGLVLFLLLIVYMIFHYDGMTTYYYPNGKIEAKGKLVHGDMHGKWTVWDEQGNLESVQFYNHGLEDSIWASYYKEGTVRRTVEYEDGIFQGKQTFYYSDGKIESESLYKDHRPNGMCVIYYENGQKKEEGNYLNGYEEGYWNFWHENGQILSSGLFTKGEKRGIWKFYFPDGRLQSIINYTDINSQTQELYDSSGKRIVWNGDGIFKEYYKNGKIKEEGIYKGGIYTIKNWWTETGEQSIIDGTGYQIIKNDQGCKISEGKYTDSKPDGTWKYYSEQGVLLGQVNYKNGKLNGESIYYYESGEIYSKGNFVNNEQDDLWIWYSWNGKKDSQVKFNRGKKEGEQLFWSPITEKVVRKEFYTNGDLVKVE